MAKNNYNVSAKTEDKYGLHFLAFASFVSWG